MSKIQIAKVSVLNMEYRGERSPPLEIGYHYIAVVIEGFVEDRSQVILEFQNVNRTKMIYDSFVSFAKDWDILSEFKFTKCYLPPTAA